MSKKKKKWITPHLQVLVKGKPGERLLDYCKGESGEGPSTDRRRCAKKYPDADYCSRCRESYFS